MMSLTHDWMEIFFSPTDPDPSDFNCVHDKKYGGTWQIIERQISKVFCGPFDVQMYNEDWLLIDVQNKPNKT